MQSGGSVSVGNGKYAELQIAGSGDSNEKLDVQGGTVTVFNGVPTDNKIYFFKAGANSGYTAAMTQSAGTVTANGIQFGGSTGTCASSATLQLGTTREMAAPDCRGSPVNERSSTTKRYFPAGRRS